MAKSTAVKSKRKRSTPSHSTGRRKPRSRSRSSRPKHRTSSRSRSKSHSKHRSSRSRSKGRKSRSKHRSRRDDGLRDELNKIMGKSNITKSFFSGKKVGELREYAKTLKLDQEGTKDVLVKRIFDFASQDVLPDEKPSSVEALKPLEYFQQLKLSELKDYAKAHSIKGISVLNKADLASLLHKKQPKVELSSATAVAAAAGAALLGLGAAALAGSSPTTDTIVNSIPTIPVDQEGTPLSPSTPVVEGGESKDDVAYLTRSLEGLEINVNETPRPQEEEAVVLDINTIVNPPPIIPTTPDFVEGGESKDDVADLTNKFEELRVDVDETPLPVVEGAGDAVQAQSIDQLLSQQTQSTLANLTEAQKALATCFGFI